MFCTYVHRLETESGIPCAHLRPGVHKALGKHSAVSPRQARSKFCFESESRVLRRAVTQAEAGASSATVQSEMLLGQVGGARRHRGVDFSPSARLRNAGRLCLTVPGASVAGSAAR